MPYEQHLPGQVGSSAVLFDSFKWIIVHVAALLSPPIVCSAGTAKLAQTPAIRTLALVRTSEQKRSHGKT